MIWAGPNGVFPGTLLMLQLLCWKRCRSQAFHCLEKAYLQNRIGEWTNTKSELRKEECKIWQCNSSWSHSWFGFVTIYIPPLGLSYFEVSFLCLQLKEFGTSYLNRQLSIKYSRCMTEKCMPKIPAISRPMWQQQPPQHLLLVCLIFLITYG